MFTNYLPWATHIGKSSDELLAMQDDVEPFGKLILLTIDGKELSLEREKKIPDKKLTSKEWATCLTAMRTTATEAADARILLGGSVSGFLGVMPGIAEEALITLHQKKPIYVLGGFGGCAGDIVTTIANPGRRAKRAWVGRKNFKSIKVKDFRNGLSPKQNEHMSSTPFVDTIIPYLLSELELKLNKRK